jgi:ethanolamine permease
MSDPPPSTHDETLHLKKVLGPLTLWGLGVGYVISGEYFGWNLGLPLGGTYGLLIAFLLITVMYLAFVFSYAELACAIPRAGGVFVYGVRGLGLAGGFLGGIAQLVEFVFAPPAIAMAIDAYVRNRFDVPDNGSVALVAFLMFTALNIWGVKQAAIFELVITILAVGELLVFTAVVAPHFQWERFSAQPWAERPIAGTLAAIPFAIWFYLAIEGVANAAEETKNPQRDVLLGFGSAILTLVVLAALVLFVSIGVGGWQGIVYDQSDLSTAADGTLVVASDAPQHDDPLPRALAQAVGRGHVLYDLLIGVGMLGLIASFNGIILIAGRALFEMGRVGFLPRFVGHTHPRTKTPVMALVLNMVFGMIAILLLDTGRLITMSAMGAVTLYMVSMLALMRLRAKEPELARPYRTPLYPLLPILAMLIATLSLLAMLYFNFEGGWSSISAAYLAFVAGAFAYFFLFVRPRLTAEDIAHFQRID